MTFLFRVSFPCILLDILSLSRLCGRLSPFLRNLRTNRKLTYYIQHPTECLRYQNSYGQGRYDEAYTNVGGNYASKSLGTGR